MPSRDTRADLAYRANEVARCHPILTAHSDKATILGWLVAVGYTPEPPPGGATRPRELRDAVKNVDDAWDHVARAIGPAYERTFLGAREP